MALPGVRTVLKDRFYTLSRQDAPDGITLAIIARRADGYDVADDSTLPQDYDAYRATSEDAVMAAFGPGSELHRAYLEATSGGASRVDLIPVPSTVTDTDYATPGDDGPLTKAFDAIEVAQADIIVPWARGSHPTEWQDPATPDDDPGEIGLVAEDFAQTIADHCRAISDRSNPCFAVMGVSPYAGASGADSAIPATDINAHLATVATAVGRDDIGDNGYLLNVIATEIKPTSYQNEWGYANGAATYAGLLSTLKSEVAPTGRALYNIRGLRYSPPRPVQQDLVDNGIVPVALNYNRNPIVVDGLTFAAANSDYARLSTLRIVLDAIQLIREAAQKFIGMPATFEHRSSLETAITNRLRQMTVGGALLDSDFVITYVPSQNKAVIDLILRPAFEIRNIEISIAVDLGG